jgi:hypothetical protein
MNRYVATFHTHFAALSTYRAMTGAGVSSTLAPVPRALSSSCGTCVKYASDDPCLTLMHRDCEQVVFERAEGVYERVAAP